MATVKDVLDAFLDRINQPREASYVGASTPAARQYVSLFNFVANQLLDNPNGWTQLKRIYTFTVSTGVSSYQLPGDYQRMCLGTQYSVTNQIPLIGPISNAQLAFQQYGVTPITPYASYQVNGAQGYTFSTSPYTQKSAGYFEITPPGPNDTDVNVIQYFSCNHVWPQNWAPSTAYVVGNIRTGINNIYYCTTSGTSGTTRLSATSGTIVDGTCTWLCYHEPYPLTADTDFFLLDDDLMIEGLRWAWYQSKKQDFAELKKQWESSVKSAVGRQNGAVMVNAAGPYDSVYGGLNVPVGSWVGYGDV